MSAQSAVPMGRKRTRDFDLPPRMYRRGGRLYYVTHERRWLPLGTDLARAKRLWAEYETIGGAQTVTDAVEGYLASPRTRLAASSLKQYKAAATAIDAEWGRMHVADLSAPAIVAFRDSAKPMWANTVIVVLRHALAYAIERGWLTHNIAQAVELNPGNVRERELLPDEFRRIRLAAPQWVRTWMDLAYVTGMRPSDVLALKWEQVGEAITHRTRKTKVRQAFALTDGLRDVLEEARRRRILGLYVVANDKGRPMSLRRLQSAWRAACKAAGVEDAQPRDVRAMYADEADRQGIDAQAGLGHKSARMTERYLKRDRVIQAPALTRKL